MSGPDPNHSAARQKWGRGSDILTSAHRRRIGDADAESSRDDGWDGDFGGASNDNDETYRGNDHVDGEENDDNLFDSIGRALDEREEDANKRVDEDCGANPPSMDNTRSAVDNYSQSENEEDLQIPEERPLDFDANARIGRLSLNGGIVGGQHNDNGHNRNHLPATSRCTFINDKTPAPNKSTTNLHRPSANASVNNTSQKVRDETGDQLSHVSKKRRESSVMKKLSPTRFSFAQSSAKPKTSSFKTPSTKSLPSRDLFSSRIMSQKSTATKSSLKKSTIKSTIQKSTNISKRKQRHTFRQSTDLASTPAVSNNVRDMGFVPTFLANSNGRSGTSPKDAPADDDDDDDNDFAYSRRDSSSAFSQNMIIDFQQQQKRQRQARKSESSNAKSGYLVQRLRSLRNTDQRTAMRLRSGQYSNSGSSSAFMSRKRRRSGNDYLDLKNNASSTVDATVSGSSLSETNASIMGEGRNALVAYIHRYTMTKQPLSGHNEQINGMATPCFAWIIMSQDEIREQGISDGGTKQLRFYDAVVIPPRVVSTNPSTVASNEVNQHDINSQNMPTIVCTHVCQEYPAEQPLLEEVSFEQFDQGYCP